MTFAEKVKYVRGKLLISQIELANELGVSNVTINRWEMEATRPSFLAEKKFDAFCVIHNIRFEE